MKLLQSATFAILLLLLSSLYLEQASAAATEFCNSKCAVRCSKASVRDGCLKYCGICCNKCNCVPSGTYGHKDECPCYRDFLTAKKTPKCP